MTPRPIFDCVECPSIEATYAPVNCYLVLLLQGWRLPDVVEPMEGHHGHYSILLTREEG